MIILWFLIRFGIITTHSFSTVLITTRQEKIQIKIQLYHSHTYIHHIYTVYYTFIHTSYALSRSPFGYCPPPAFPQWGGLKRANIYMIYWTVFKVYICMIHKYMNAYQCHPLQIEKLILVSSFSLCVTHLQPGEQNFKCRRRNLGLVLRNGTTAQQVTLFLIKWPWRLVTLETFEFDQSDEETWHDQHFGLKMTSLP